MKYWQIALLSSFSLYVGGAESEEESLFLRRIADFWQEGEYQIAKSQIQEFIQQYPQSPFSDALCAALGDLFLREKSFSTALSYYAQVQSPEFANRIFLSRMQCLYEMQWYATLIDECEAHLSQNESNLHVRYFLAIALYHQCLSCSQETDLLQKIAKRAKPHFETLYQSELKEEIAQGYAHLCCILKEYEKATEIYLNLPEKDEEEILFQVALIQSEFNKNLAMETFDKIAKLEKSRAKEATYNKLILAYDLGYFEQLADRSLLKKIPLDRVDSLRLFIGKSFLNLGQHEKAIQELKAYVQNASSSEALYAAILSLLDASFQCADLLSLDEALFRLQKDYPNDPELPKALFSKAQILKRKEDFEGARTQIQTLLSQFPDMEQKPQALFELIHLNYKEKFWEKCYENGGHFLTDYESHELAPFVRRYLVSASSEMGKATPSHRKQLLEDLKDFLKLPLPDIEKTEWQLLLAKTHYEMQDYESAQLLLKDLNTPNAQLLFALCLREDPEKFCNLCEEALKQGADLVPLAQIHISLYNAYLQLGQTEKSAEHLFSAFMEKAEIKTENLLWLIDFYFEQLHEDNPIIAARTTALLTHCKAALHEDLFSYKLAKVYSILGRVEDAIEKLESISPSSSEARLLLAEMYAKKGKAEKAIELFDEIVLSCGTVRAPIAASASLQAIRLKLEHANPDLPEIAKQLKDLVIQKNFEGEPFHLEAALQYIDLQAKNDPEKKLALLKKTKQAFESEEDLLSKDYHEARKSSPQKEKLYQNYMMFIDADIFATLAFLDPQNKDLKAKSKDLFLKIMTGSAPVSLKERTQRMIDEE